MALTLMWKLAKQAFEVILSANELNMKTETTRTHSPLAVELSSVIVNILHTIA